MKRILALLTVVLLSALAIAATTLPQNLVLSVSASGTANADEKRAMNAVIAEYNAAKFAADTNFVALPSSTANERRSSYVTVMAVRLNAQHAELVSKYGSASSSGNIIPGDDMDIIIRLIVDRLQAGETIQAVEADLSNP